MINFIQNLVGTENAYLRSKKVKSLVKIVIPIAINIFKFLIANRKSLKKVINIEELKKLLTNMKGKVEEDATSITNSAEEIKTTNAEIAEKTESIVDEVKKLARNLLLLSESEHKLAHSLPNQIDKVINFFTK